MNEKNSISLDNIGDQEETEKLISDTNQNNKKTQNETYLNSNYKTKKNPYFENKQYQYLDQIIESLSISKFHWATISVCFFSMMTLGYQSAHYVFCKNQIMSKYSWTSNSYCLFFIVQKIIESIGAFISVTSTTLEWDITSNILIGLISFFSLIFLMFFNEGPLFIILTLIFSYCGGFVNNICCNFLLEEFKIKYRELAFLLVNSGKLFGFLFFGFFEYIIYDVLHKENPIISIIGLILFQFCLAFSLCYFKDSPRLLYYNHQYDELYNYMENSINDDIRKYRKNIVSKIILTQEKIEKDLGRQAYNDLIEHFFQLWNEPFSYVSLKSVIMIFLSSFLMSNIKDSYSYFLKDQYLFIFIQENLPHHRIITYYLCTIGGYLIITLIKYFFNIPRKFLTIFCLLMCILFLIFVNIYEKNYLYFLCVFETFAFFYYTMVYLYFSSFTTTQLRNSMTSLLYMIASFSSIFQISLMNSMTNFQIFRYLNYFVAALLGILEIFLLNYDTGRMKMEEIEILLLYQSKLASQKQ